MAQLEHIEAIEKRLWGAADTLRANSNYASNEYFLPVMGLVFLRHAYSRYLAVKDGIEANLPKRGGKARALTKEDFSEKGAIFLKPGAQFDHLVALPDSEDRAKAIISAMESIEADYDNLRGVLPKSEYQELNNDVLGQLLRTLNPDELKRVSGDVFGRIYEYFLTQFADQKAHDGGEFFTPVSLVSLIAHVLAPDRGTVLDPACGSGGMFVQSARTVEEHGESPTERLTFRGLEKNATTIRLAKMNLAVHGLEGDIQQAITYYEDPHELVGGADYVMANPPFNVDEVDADKTRSDPRLSFGLPGVNKKRKVGNANYLWIQYFYSYLNETGKCGFVMATGAETARGKEKKIRQGLVETGHVDAMIAIGTNFFYTRTVPCMLWFFDKGKPAERTDRVLMLDARGIYRRVTRVISDFSPEQLDNITAILQLHRGDTGRFLSVVRSHLMRAAEGARSVRNQLTEYRSRAGSLIGELEECARRLQGEAEVDEAQASALETCCGTLGDLWASHGRMHDHLDIEIQEHDAWAAASSLDGNEEQHEALARMEPIAANSRAMRKLTDQLAKSLVETYAVVRAHRKLLPSKAWNESHIRALYADTVDNGPGSHSLRVSLNEALSDTSHFVHEARWLQSRFPEAQYADVSGLCKDASLSEIASKDWSLAPGQYVGYAPPEPPEGFDIETEVARLQDDFVRISADTDAHIRGTMQSLGMLRCSQVEYRNIFEDLPAGWSRRTLSDVCSSIEDGDWIETKDQGGDEYRLLQISNIGINQFVETGNMRYISGETFQRLRCREVVAGDILVSRMPKPIGRAWMVRPMPWKMVTAVDVAILRPDPDELEPLLLLYYLNSPFFFGLCETASTGATRPRITKRHLADLPILVPPTDLREDFVRAIRPMHDLHQNLNEQILNVDEARHLILPQWAFGNVSIERDP